ncbi:MAG: hypothetical protein IPL33_01935 [Sphingobacteriales bacterium]|nr:hypothetical protein [Sphingobacteriales bacterium]
MHRILGQCASLGEFEQGRPLIEALRRHYPQCRIWLTFYSPSGYTVRYRYELADWVGYLPLDTAANARQLIDALQPTAVFGSNTSFGNITWRHTRAGYSRLSNLGAIYRYPNFFPSLRRFF